MAACSSTPSRAHLPAAPGIFPRTLRVQVAEQGNAIRKIPLEEYVQGSILSEFAPPSGDSALVEQMFEVQAIVSRTYAIGNHGRHARDGFDMCATTHCQLYEPSRLQSSRWAAAAMEAVSRTAGVILWHGKAPILAIFNADCGGYTSTPMKAWGGTARPYLTARPDDDGVQPVAHAEWHYQVTAAELRRVLNTDSRTRVGSRLDAVRVVDRDQSGRAEAVAISGETGKLVAGEVLRSVVTRELGARTVKSAMFDLRRDRNTFLFDGKGFGHGVGLCQAGALSRLRSGTTPEAVLLRYFPATVLRSLYN